MVVLMKYFFIHAKKDVITVKNNGMKNSKEKRTKKWRSEEVLIGKEILKKIYVNL